MSRRSHKPDKPRHRAGRTQLSDEAVGPIAPAPNVSRTLLLGARLAIAVWGCLLALWLSWAFFLLPVDAQPTTHEGNSYPLRLLEFHNCLASGYWSPQWCSHFWGGLGSPHFSYYQPGFFYVASLPAWIMHPVRALGVAVFAFGLLGYAGMFTFVARRFDAIAGVLAASGLLLSVYAGTEIFVRGDLSEFAALMTLPWALVALARLCKRPDRVSVVRLACVAGALVVLHPCIALVTWPLLLLAVCVASAVQRDWRLLAGGSGALLLGGGLAAFYWWPVYFELDLVQSERLTAGMFSPERNFSNWMDLVAPYRRVEEHPFVPLTLGPVLPALAIVNLAVLMGRWRGTSTAQRWQLLSCCFVALAALAMCTSSSAWLWAHVPLLPKLQFPWRFQALATVALAAAAGGVAAWRTDRWRTAYCVAAIVALCWTGRVYGELGPAQPARLPTNVEELQATFFQPDLAFEWLPRGAIPLDPTRRALPPSASSNARIEDFVRSQGRLSLRVRAPQGGVVVLPHYYFPTGWRATLDDQELPLVAGPAGLMQVALPAGTDGQVRVEFSTTPARRGGLYVTLLATLVSGTLLLSTRSGPFRLQLRTSP